MAQSDNQWYITSRLNKKDATAKEGLSPYKLLQSLILDMMPQLQDEREVNRIADMTSPAAVHDAVSLLYKQYKSRRAKTSWDPANMMPSSIVQDDRDKELFMRTAEAMLSRVLTSANATKQILSIQCVDEVIESVSEVQLVKSKDYDSLKAKMASKETLLFKPFRVNTTESGSVVCQQPNVCMGFGDGIVLCKVLLGRTFRVTSLEDPIPQGCGSIYVVERPVSKLSLQPGKNVKLQHGTLQVN
jgi:hypothetical protein